MRCLNQTFLGKAVRNVKTPHNRGQIDPRRRRPAQQFGDAPLERLALLLRIARDFDHDLLAGLRAERLLLRNNDIRRKARVVRNHDAAVIFAPVVADQPAHTARHNLHDAPLAALELLPARNQNADGVALQCAPRLVTGDKDIVFLARNADKAEALRIRRKDALLLLLFRFSVLAALRDADSALPHEGIQCLLEIPPLGLRHIEKQCDFPEAHGLVHRVFHQLEQHLFSLFQ